MIDENGLPVLFMEEGPFSSSQGTDAEVRKGWNGRPFSFGRILSTRYFCSGNSLWLCPDTDNRTTAFSEA